MNAARVSPPAERRTWTAAELRALPPEERDAILEAAAEAAAELYVTGSELTSFEACAADDLYGLRSEFTASR
jgi:hypothetical protein